jgi:FkbM family methyltransferase
VNRSQRAAVALSPPADSAAAGSARPSPWERLRWRALRFGARHGVDVVSTVRSGPAAGLRFGSVNASADYSSGRNERWVQEAVAGALRPGSVFFDVGANVGFFALLAARAVGPRGRVVAVEPMPANAAALRRNVERNGEHNVTVVEAAAGREPGRGRLGLSTHPGGNALESTGAPTDVTGFVEVDVVTIDDLVQGGQAPPPSLVKIDTESGEAEVIEGMGRVLATHRPSVLIELDAATVAEVDDKAAGVEGLLAPAGYRVGRLQPSYPNRRWQVVHLWAEPLRG